MDDWFMTTAPYAIPCYKSAFFVLCQRTPYPDDSPLNRPRALNSLSSLLYLHEKTANRQIRRFSLLKLPSLRRRLYARSKRSRFILGPCCDKVVHELCLRIGAGIHFGHSA